MIVADIKHCGQFVGHKGGTIIVFELTQKEVMRYSLTFLFISILIYGCGDSDGVEPKDYIDIKTANTQYTFTYTNSGSYYIGDNQDQLSIVMATDDNTKCEIHLSLTDLLNKSFPYSIPKESDGGYGEIQIRNENIIVDPIFGNNDDINFLGHTYQGLEIEIRSFKNNILTGKVTGPIRTKTGKEEIIESGEFRLKVEIERTN